MMTPHTQGICCEALLPHTLSVAGPGLLSRATDGKLRAREGLREVTPEHEAS